MLVSSGAIGIGLRRLKIDHRPAEVAKAQVRKELGWDIVAMDANV